MTTCKPARGKRGFLCRDITGEYFFRVYSDDKATFIDYRMRHSDLEIEIVDEDSAFYEHAEESVLDHAPDVLGMRGKT
jgi:hypothetical protein